MSKNFRNKQDIKLTITPEAKKVLQESKGKRAEYDLKGFPKRMDTILMTEKINDKEYQVKAIPFNFLSILEFAEKQCNSIEELVFWFKDFKKTIQQTEIEQAETGFHSDNQTLHKLIDLEIEKGELCLMWGKSSQAENFKPHGYGEAKNIDDLLKVFPIGQRKMYRFIKSESTKPSPFIKKLISGKYCIKNNCQSKLKEALNY